MTEENITVDLPSESETSQVSIDSPELEDQAENDEQSEQKPLTKEQKKILELKAQKKSLTEQKYRERQEKQQILAELEALRNQVNQPKAGEEEDLESLIERRAKELIQQQEVSKKDSTFAAACNSVYEHGLEDYPDFDARVKNLTAIGIDRDTLEYITDSGVGHKMLHYLSEDLEETERIMKLPVLKKAEEIFKLRDKVDKTYKKRTSNLPEPIPSVSGRSAKANIGDIANDYDAFNKWLETGLK